MFRVRCVHRGAEIDIERTEVHDRIKRLVGIAAYMQASFNLGDFRHIKRKVPYMREELDELAALLRSVKA